MKTTNNNQLKNRPFIYKILEIFGVFGIGFWAIYLLVTNVLFVFKRPINTLNLPLSFFISLVFILWYARKKYEDYLKLVCISLFVFFVTFMASFFISGSVYDLSYDGQAYHQEAVILLNHGWNPVYTVLTNEATANLERWLNHYPKATWLWATGIYKWTGNIEYGKMLSIDIVFIAMALCFWGMSDLAMPLVLKVLVVITLVFNPVVIYQLLSYYLDGVLVSLLVCLGAILFRLYKDKDKSLFFPFLFAFVTLVNVKLSSPVFALELIAGFVVYAWFSSRQMYSLKLFKFTLIGLIVGILLIGYNPYVLNFAEEGNPLFPAVGKGSVDYIKNNEPRNYWDLFSPLRFVSSIFAESSLARGSDQYAKLKIPFTFSLSELETFHETNAKTGGFGPLFGGITVVTGIVFLLFIVSRKISLKYKIISCFIVFGVWGAAAIIPTGSVARFVPFAWWVPVLLSLVIFLGKYRFGKIIILLILFLSLVNSGLVAYSYIPYNAAQSIKLEKQLKDLSNTYKGKTMVINIEQFGSTRLKLESHHISYSEVYKVEDCKNRKKFLIANTTNLCDNNK